MAFPQSPTTLLAINGISLSDYATRGITAKLSTISAAQYQRRDCRGVLRNLAVPQFQKYSLSVSCSDHEAPNLTGIFPGHTVDITIIEGLGLDGGTDPVVLTMMLRTPEIERDEAEAQTSWTLEFEEVGEDDATT